MIVTEHVKNFIQKNKEIIRNEEWPLLFFYWVKEFKKLNLINDDILINNLFEVLDKAGYSNIEKVTEGARTSLIIDMLIQEVEDQLNNQYNNFEVEISYSDLCSNIPCFLGFEVDELYDIIETSNFAGHINRLFNAKLDTVEKRIVLE